MMKKNNTLFWVQGALIAALYLLLCLLQELIVPSSTSGLVQVRLAEILCVLSVFTPAAIPGLTVGCFLSNLISAGVMPIDLFMGTAATFLSAICSYYLRYIKFFKVPFMSFLMPVLFNGIIIGLELELFYIKGTFEFLGFITQGGLVASGELIACVVLGIPFYFILMRTPLGKGYSNN